MFVSGLRECAKPTSLCSATGGWEVRKTFFEGYAYVITLYGVTRGRCSALTSGPHADVPRAFLKYMYTHYPMELDVITS